MLRILLLLLLYSKSDCQMMTDMDPVEELIMDLLKESQTILLEETQKTTAIKIVNKLQTEINEFSTMFNNFPGIDANSAKQELETIVEDLILDIGYQQAFECNGEQISISVEDFKEELEILTKDFVMEKQMDSSDEPCLHVDERLTGTDLPGGRLRELTAVTPELCQDACFQDSQCKYFLYFSDKHYQPWKRRTCRLLSLKGDYEDAPGHISGPEQCTDDSNKGLELSVHEFLNTTLMEALAMECMRKIEMSTTSEKLYLYFQMFVDQRCLDFKLVRSDQMNSFLKNSRKGIERIFNSESLHLLPNINKNFNTIIEKLRRFLMEFCIQDQGVMKRESSENPNSMQKQNNEKDKAKIVSIESSSKKNDVTSHKDIHYSNTDSGKIQENTQAMENSTIDNTADIINGQSSNDAGKGTMTKEMSKVEDISQLESYINMDDKVFLSVPNNLDYPVFEVEFQNNDKITTDIIEPYVMSEASTESFENKANRSEDDMIGDMTVMNTFNELDADLAESQMIESLGSNPTTIGNVMGNFKTNPNEIGNDKQTNHHKTAEIVEIKEAMLPVNQFEVIEEPDFELQEYYDTNDMLDEENLQLTESFSSSTAPMLMPDISASINEESEELFEKDNSIENDMNTEVVQEMQASKSSTTVDTLGTSSSTLAASTMGSTVEVSSSAAELLSSTSSTTERSAENASGSTNNNKPLFWQQFFRPS